MMTLEDLKSVDDGGCFDRLAEKVKVLADGDESFASDFLTALTLHALIRKHTQPKLLAVKEKESNFKAEFVNLRFRIPKKIRSSTMKKPAVRKKDSLDKKRKADDSCLEEKKKEALKQVVDESLALDFFSNQSTMKKPAVRKKDSLDKKRKADDSCLEEKKKKTLKEVVDCDESLALDFFQTLTSHAFVRKHTQPKLLAVKERESNFKAEFINLRFRIPKKIRSSNKSTIKKPAERKTNSLDKKRKADDSCLKEKKKNKKRTIINKNNLDDQLGLTQPSELPQEFKARIQRLNGTDVMLVIQKELTRTDLNSHQGRLAMPRGQLRTHDFLTEQEIHTLSRKGFDGNQGIQCSLIQPCLEEVTNLELKKWNMDNTFSYTLIKNWKSVANNIRNNLQPDSKVQLWSFRVGPQLWFALIKL